MHLPYLANSCILTNVIRPCFLVIDREHAGTISTRKLVIETAKLNVITAYSAQEGIDSLIKFPNVDGAVLDAGIEHMHFDKVIARLKEIKPKLPVIVITTPDQEQSELADYELETFDPIRLLELLRKISPGDAKNLADQ